MKRLLTILVVLLLVLGGLFWWRKSKDHLRYTFDKTYIPFRNNLSLRPFVNDFNDSQYFLIDSSKYQTIPSLNSISNTSLFDIILGNQSDFRIIEISSFMVINNIVYFKGGEFFKHSSLNLNTREFKDTLAPKAQWPKGFHKSKDFKTPEEWHKTWKRDGRLPWFPEHVGK